MSLHFRSIIGCLALVFLTGNVYSQFGISTEIRHYPLAEWEEVTEGNLFDINYGVSVDYWTRLKNYRWEMVPTLSASMSTQNTSNVTDQVTYGLSTYRFQVKNNLYLLDFKNDCNCPTFSKQSGWFKKSFYLQVAPGYAYNRLSATILPSDKLVNGKHQFELGIGAGFDFGLSDLVTISPYFNYVITSKIEQPYLFTPDALVTNMNHLVAGVRLGLRPDYARPKTMRRRNLRY